MLPLWVLHIHVMLTVPTPYDTMCLADALVIITIVIRVLL